jgi:hypothetical protein
VLTDPERDLYRLLELPGDAPVDDIRAAVRRLRGRRSDEDLAEAVMVLLDPQVRVRYDTQRAAHRVHAAGGPHRP